MHPLVVQLDQTSQVATSDMYDCDSSRHHTSNLWQGHASAAVLQLPYDSSSLLGLLVMTAVACLAC
jgi:hypothetical protein